MDWNFVWNIVAVVVVLWAVRLLLNIFWRRDPENARRIGGWIMIVLFAVAIVESYFRYDLAGALAAAIGVVIYVVTRFLVEWLTGQGDSDG